MFPVRVSAQIINEVNSGTSDDWVEIYNNSAVTIDLSLYKLTDKAGNEKALLGSLAPEGFLAFDWSNRLNNDGDIVYLMRISDGQTLETLTYGSEGGVCAPDSTQSVGRVNNGNVFERLSPTKNATNVGAQLFPCPTPTQGPTASPTQAPTSVPTATPIKTPTPVPTKTPTPKSSPTTSPEIAEDATSNPSDVSVLGLRDQMTEEVKDASKSSEKKNFPIIAIGFIVAGVAFIGYSGYVIFKKSRNQI